MYNSLNVISKLDTPFTSDYMYITDIKDNVPASVILEQLLIIINNNDDDYYYHFYYICRNIDYYNINYTRNMS